MADNNLEHLTPERMQELYVDYNIKYDISHVYLKYGDDGFYKAGEYAANASDEFFAAKEKFIALHGQAAFEEIENNVKRLVELYHENMKRETEPSEFDEGESDEW